MRAEEQPVYHEDLRGGVDVFDVEFDDGGVVSSVQGEPRILGPPDARRLDERLHDVHFGGVPGNGPRQERQSAERAVEEQRPWFWGLRG